MCNIIVIPSQPRLETRKCQSEISFKNRVSSLCFGFSSLSLVKIHISLKNSRLLMIPNTASETTERQPDMVLNVDGPTLRD